jgi:uncharacterized protein YnzC (UPF0291/DUF896 family)
MNKRLIQQLPNLENLPETLQGENAVKLVFEQGVLIFRASKEMKNRIETLLEKEKSQSITDNEIKELDSYQEIDDYLNHVNRIIRNSFETEVNLAA